MTRINVEEKLFQNRYKVDAGRPHIQIKDGDVCRSQCKTQQCTVCCPAGCYTAEGNGAVTLITDGCLECGTCKAVCRCTRCGPISTTALRKRTRPTA